MDYINKIKNLKILNNKNILDIDEIINFISLDKPFDDLEKLHLFLLSEIKKLHEDEISTVNTHKCKESSSAFECLDKCEDTKIGGKIYFLNNDLAKYYIFGDIHSDSISVIEFLKRISFLEKIQSGQNIRLVFLGDYVDRGKATTRTLELILILKYIFPCNIFLLRGNHDGGTIISENEYKLCVGRNENTTDDDYFVASLFNSLKKMNKPLTLLEEYLNFFNNLCHLALIKNGDDVVLCVHGGIPRPTNDDYNHIHTISDLWNEGIVDSLDGSVIHNMLWSDPTEDTSLQRNTRRFYFYKTHFDNFTNKFSISNIIRGHQAFDEGYKEFFNGRLISIFSSGDISLDTKETNNETAYKDIIPCILKLYGGKKETIRLL